MHPGESPASFVARGLLDFLCSADPDARRRAHSSMAPQSFSSVNYLSPLCSYGRLRSLLTFVIVPMLNPDGCYAGNYRTDSLGADLNRMWEAPGPSTEPTLHAAKALLLKYEADPAASLDFYVDVHAHSNARSGFFLCNPPRQRDCASFERAALLPRLMDARLRDFSLAACRFDADPLKMGSARRVASLP